MATELDTRLWFSEKKRGSKDLFLNLLEIITAADMCQDHWSNLSIVENVPSNRIFKKVEKQTVPEIGALLESYQQENLKFTVYVPIKSWRFSGAKAEEAFVQLAVSCWGKEYGKTIGFDHALEGNASISILSVGPYCKSALGESYSQEVVGQIDRLIEENIQLFTGLLLKIMEGIAIEKMLSFSDAGAYLSVNAHIACFASKEKIIQECEYLREILLKGNQSYQLRSIMDKGVVEDNHMFHEWRSEEDKGILCEKLLRALSHPVEITRSKVEVVFDSGKYDFFEGSKGIMILNYPFFANDFLDDFFLDMLLE